MSRTPFWLVNTGGSWKAFEPVPPVNEPPVERGLAIAVTPPAAHKAMITLATPTDRRSRTADVTGLLNISSLPASTGYRYIRSRTDQKSERRFLPVRCRCFSPYDVEETKRQGPFYDMIANYPGILRGLQVSH